MSSERPSQERYVLRRLAPSQWERAANQAKTSAFTLRLDEEGLSVFEEGTQTPRSLLQKLLDDQHEKYQHDPQKLEKWLQSNGRTVEELVKKNWRVARVPVSAFTGKGFQLEEPEPDGHQNVRGTLADFDKYSDALSQNAVLLSEEECLQQP